MVHQAILAAQTPYFKAISNFQVRRLAAYSLIGNCVTKKQEGESNTIDLKALGSGVENEEDAPVCDHPLAIQCMIHFFYHLDYDFSGKPVPEKHRNNLELHARIFAAAVKYQVSALRYLSAVKFAADLKKYRWRAKSFASAVDVIYTTTPEDARELRDIVTKVITDHAVLMDDPTLKAIAMDINGLAWELLRMSKGLPAALPATNALDSSCFHCGSKENLSGCKCGRACESCKTEVCPFCDDYWTFEK